MMQETLIRRNVRILAAKLNYENCIKRWRTVQEIHSRYFGVILKWN